MLLLCSFSAVYCYLFALPVQLTFTYKTPDHKWIQPFLTLPDTEQLNKRHHTQNMLEAHKHQLNTPTQSPEPRPNSHIPLPTNHILCICVVRPSPFWSHIQQHSMWAERVGMGGCTQRVQQHGHVLAWPWKALGWSRILIRPFLILSVNGPRKQSLHLV